MDFQTIDLFPTKIHVLFSPKSPDSLINFLYSEKSKDPKGNLLSNEGGWQSQNIVEYPIFKDLKEFLNTQIYNIYKVNAQVSSIWGNISSTHHYNLLHQHSYDPITISGVYYLKTPPNCGEIFFHNESDLNESYMLTPIANSILFFRGKSPHRVGPNKSTQDRISLAFNFNLNL